MKKMKLSLVVMFLVAVILAVSVPARAAEEVQVKGDGIVQTVLAPVRWTTRFLWGVSNLTFKVGKAPLDKVFETVGGFVGADPNEGMWK